MQIKTKHIYNIIEDKHIKAHKSILIASVVLIVSTGSNLVVHGHAAVSMLLIVSINLIMTLLQSYSY